MATVLNLENTLRNILSWPLVCSAAVLPSMLLIAVYNSQFSHRRLSLIHGKQTSMHRIIISMIEHTAPGTQTMEDYVELLAFR